MAQAAPSTSSAPVNLVDDNTIDESVFKTIWRDIVTIGKNLRSVLIPINWNFNNNNQDQALRNWDLWGPLVRAVRLRKLKMFFIDHARMGATTFLNMQIFMLWLAVTLSWGEKKASEVFSVSGITTHMGNICCASHTHFWQLVPFTQLLFLYVCRWCLLSVPLEQWC